MSCKRMEWCRRLFQKPNRGVLIALAVAGLCFAGAGAVLLVANLRFNDVTTANCREIEQIKTYVRATVKRGPRLRAKLDFDLSRSDLALLEEEDAKTLRRFHREPCPRTQNDPP